MKNKIDIKSAIIGALLTATLILGVAAVTDEEEQIGRYQLGNNDSRVYLLDSATGQIWTKSSPHRLKSYSEFKDGKYDWI